MKISGGTLTVRFSAFAIALDECTSEYGVQGRQLLSQPFFSRCEFCFVSDIHMHVSLHQENSIVISFFIFFEFFCAVVWLWCGKQIIELF
jgi:hypothetical protein